MLLPIKKLIEFLTRSSRKKIVKMTVIGPSQSGKTTLLNLLSNKLSGTNEGLRNPPRTLGIEHRSETIKINDLEVSAIDVGGQSFYMDTLWKIAIDQADVVVYLIDGSVLPSDPRFAESVQTFQFAMHLLEEQMPVLIGINKCDLSYCLSTEFVLKTFFTPRIRSILYNCPHEVVRFSALTGENVISSFQWLEHAIKFRIGLSQGKLTMNQIVKSGKSS